MLTQEIKKKIDSARDILVGKVPDPKAQVEQITTALIYKFMDDMDKQAASLPKGKAQFFTNGFEKYAWGKMMDGKLGGQERLNLYVEAISKMSKNQYLPQLFRDVFKDAFLPYRDPETLNLFLKDINTFSYDHSENLGDAFEYLLSILGSQGDAGQFRTPRHIIDFIVEVLNPKKDESILDPACGTAGFLISAYKHILKANKNKPLTPDEKKHLMKNLAGYDISPDMVKLSLVNMYLHGFSDPNIHEYDTLTSDDKWDERFDVMMANPPFMTPKGGIRPHKRFIVDANRAEVLFVDYIMEHLNSKGRAGIIVPEGVIFTAANAYKQLRKLLVEDGLYAVVSLPAGVFNPYSGVKTSILFFDNELVQKSKDILFIKVLNDGFNLGAQRKPIEHNDLGKALDILKTQQDIVKNGKKSQVLKKGNQFAWVVSKKEIAENGDYNLSGDRYASTVERTNKQWGSSAIGEVCVVKKGSPITEKSSIPGAIPVIAGGQKPAYYHNTSNRTGNVITVSASGAYAGYVNYFSTPIFASDCTTIQSNDEEILLTRFVYFLLKARQDYIYTLQQGGAQPHVYPKDLMKLQIPVPPIEIQKQLIEELNNNQKIVDGAKQIIENYLPSFQTLPDWQATSFGDICSLEYGKALPEREREKGEYPVLGSNGIVGYHNKSIVKSPAIIVGRKGSAGEVIWVEKDCYPIDTTYYVVPKDLSKIDMKFLFYLLKAANLRELRGGGAVPGLNRNDVYRKSVRIPNLKTQQKIVKEIEAEQKYIDNALGTVETFENKIKSKMTEIWG